MNRTEKNSINPVMVRYGIEILSDGGIRGPKRPIHYSETPRFQYGISSLLGRALRKNDVKARFEKVAPIEDWPDALEIVAEIFSGITGRHMDEFVRFVVMRNEDFKMFAQAIRPEIERREVKGLFSGIALGGLVVMIDPESNSFFPLAFHEAGHCLYRDENDIYVDEFRAYFFQIVATRIFEKALRQVGVRACYSNNTEFPSEQHRIAYRDANILVGYLSHYDMIVAGSERAERQMKRFLAIINQPFCELNFD